MQTIIREEDLNAFNNELSQKLAERNAQLAEANKRPPTDQDLQNEYYQLKAAYEKLSFNAKQAEQTVNRAANRVKFFQNQLALLKGTIPSGEYDRLLAKFKAGERVYGYAETFRKIVQCEEDLADALDFLKRMRNINTSCTMGLKEFEKEALLRLEELKPIVAKQDADYSYIKGTARTKGWGRW